MNAPHLKLVNPLDDDIAAVQSEIDAKQKSDAITRAKLSKTTVLPPAGEIVTYDDLTNANRFIGTFGDDFLYLAEAKKWLYWNATHWDTDNENFVFELACEFVTELYAPENVAGSTEALKHAKRSNNAAGIEAMLKIVQKKKTVTIKDLDKQPDLFNTLSGTLHLPTGEIKRHDRNDRITKLSPYHYNPDADCERFRTFLKQIQPIDPIRDYLQEALGYSMSATYSDRAFFILYGFGRNGKSVFVDTFNQLFGNYSQNTTAESLMKKPAGQIPNDIARLRGARFITCSETEEGKQLHESLLKQITGGDKMTARFLFGEYFDFYFSGKLWIVTNHKPQIRDTSQGFWDRLKLIPFTTAIAKEQQIDKDQLIASMLEEATGILAWLVDGYRRYSDRRQLTEPEVIQREVADYRFEQDSIAQFIDQCCEIYDPEGEWSEHVFIAKNPDVYAAYKKFCDSNGEYARTQRRLSQNLIERGFRNQPKDGTRVWSGFRLNEV